MATKPKHVPHRPFDKHDCHHNIIRVQLTPTGGRYVVLNYADFFGIPAPEAQKEVKQRFQRGTVHIFRQCVLRRLLGDGAEALEMGVLVNPASIKVIEPVGRGIPTR